MEKINKIQEAIDWFQRRKNMGLSDKCQNAENTALNVLQDQAEREKENKPLTAEELQNMNDERVWDDYNQGYALVWVHTDEYISLHFKDGGTSNAEVSSERKIYKEKPVGR